MSTLEDHFLALVSENRQRILRVCRVYAWTSQDREDLYQEVLFQIWRALPKLDRPAHANTWLYRIALNTAISFVRKDASRRERITPAVHENLDASSDQRRQPPPQSANARIDDLYDAIAKLEKIDRAVMTLFLEDMSYEQIAEVTGLTPGHVGVVLHRAKKKISASMKGEVPA